jgi:2-oxoglutarate ferredoxin oxidoreductase subunit alpha
VIGGEAGAGIMVSGEMFARACSRAGLNVFGVIEYPSLIRGGHNFYQIRVEEREVFSHINMVDLVVALNKETIDLHKDEVTHNGGIIYDGDEVSLNEGEVRDDIRLYSVPLLKLTKDIGGPKVMMNTVALGASIAVLDYDLKIFENMINEVFKRKGPAIIKVNVKAAKSGYDYIKKNFPNDFKNKLEKVSSEKRMLMSGNQAIALGAIKAGCKFFAAYPMTPASPILHYLAGKERDFGMIVKHSEDEISAMNMIIGAGFAGVRSMTATSGGGFCLMVEALGLGGMTETPLVAVEVQRPGPSTGLPTHQEQGDLKFLLNASQGEFPRILIAPGDIEECFYETFKAFNLAEKYQVPVLILADRYVGESYKTVEKFNGNLKINRGMLLGDKDLKPEFKRHLFTESGVSPRWLPGQKGPVYRTTGNEHDETGLISEDPVIRTKMVDKRMKKLDTAAKEIFGTRFFGPEDADITIIGWGSTKLPIREAMIFLENDGIKVNYLQILYVSPFPTEDVLKVLNSAKKTVLIENNKTAQLGGIIREKTGIDIENKFLKYDGRQFFPSDIYDKVKELLNNG